WELSRFYHFVTLGQAYFLTGDEKYTKEFIYQTIDWIENNLPQFGVNWVCTMDVAIRVANWILGFSYLRESNLINKKFLLEFIKNLYIHGKHIIRNLEYGILTSNHYIANIVGLAYLGIIFKDFKGARNWLDFAVNEFINEMKKQVYPDGVDFEASTCYHRLVLELFFYPTLFIIKNSSYFSKNNFVEAGEKIFGKDYIKKLYKMFEFVLFSLKPNGKMPQLGDNDNGRLHIFGSREVLDMRYLLSLGAVFFKEPKFKIKEFGFCEEVLWVFGKDGYDIWNSLESISINSIGSRSFPNAGWYILRKDKNYMIVSCGPNGQNGNGGHAHNDKLSFELCVEGWDILLDPGTYVYTPIPYWRNKFRSTLFHNTVVVDGVEQNRFNDKSLFFSENDAKCKINVWKTTERYDFLDAEHYGYRRLKNPVIHRRQIFYDKNEDYWIVRDLITGEGEHKFDWCFHVAENVIFDIDRNSLAVTINGSINNEKNIELKLIPLNAGGFKFFKVDSWLSYGYGEKVSSIMLGYSKTAVVPIDFIFVIAAKEFKEFSHSKDDIVNLLESHCK
ncbi:MAG: alginate lyase family protein, partial [Actinobacteria bacterium]|nr:alginate lyase family protein [Actinomycetota bacterium]